MSRYKYRRGFAPTELRNKNESSSRLVRDQTTISFHSLKDKIDFGKYRMKTYEDVILEDPDYIQWAFDSIPGFYLDEEATKVWRNRMLAKETDENQD